MGMLIAAYLVLWMTVAIYVCWLGAGQRKLRRSIETLQRRVAQQENQDTQTSVAA